jgi:hypothetical protein
VFASCEQLQGYQPDYSHAPSLAGKPGTGATHIKQQCKPLLVRGSVQCQLCSLVRCMPPNPFLLCNKRQVCASVLQQSNLTLHATVTTSMFVDRSCFHQATSWMRQYIATTA